MPVFDTTVRTSFPIHLAGVYAIRFSIESFIYTIYFALCAECRAIKDGIIEFHFLRPLRTGNL